MGLQESGACGCPEGPDLIEAKLGRVREMGLSKT